MIGRGDANALRWGRLRFGGRGLLVWFGTARVDRSRRGRACSSFSGTWPKVEFFLADLLLLQNG